MGMICMVCTEKNELQLWRMSSRHVFFDTNVCDALARRPDSVRVLAAIAEKYTVYSSAYTFSELVNGLFIGTSAHLASHQGRVRAMAGNGTLRFLGPSREFAIRKLLGIDEQPALTPQKFQRWAKSVLTARDKDRLFAQNEELSHMASTVQVGWLDNSDVITSFQRRGGGLFSAVDFASRIATSSNLVLTDRQAQMMADGLAVAYSFLCTLRKDYKNLNTNHVRRRGAGVDIMQLLYLSDPRILFVTKEKGIITAAAATSQKNRVIALDHLLKQVGVED